MRVAALHDGTGRLFLADQTGLVRIFFMNGTVIDTPFLDIRDRMAALSPGYDERGLYAMAFHPAYAMNGRVFVYYSAPLRAGAPPGWSCTNRLSEFRVSPLDPDRVDASTEKVLLEVDKPSMNHNGGVLLFGPDDGFLYLTLGDGGGADDTGTGHTPGTGNAQDMAQLFGKVIRIDVDGTSSGREYGIPADNPFRSAGGTRPEIYASGFRNPAFATFDSVSHRMFIADAGQGLFESVFIVYRGGAYPWNIREGTHCFDPEHNTRPKSGSCPTTAAGGRPLIGPVAEIGHDAGNTIVGGVLYRGSTIPALEGSYIYGMWSDDRRGAGNGSLLVSAPPTGLDPVSLPGDAAALTPAQNAMWTTRFISIAGSENGRINAYVRALSENDEHEILVLTSRATGPSAPATGEVWLVVPADSPLPAGTTGLPAAAAKTPPQTTAAGGQEVVLTLTAQNVAFDTTNLTVPAGARVVMTFVNADPVPHNFALYTDNAALTPLFVGDTVQGPSTVTYTFTAPSAAGNYFFRCDIHPATMTGTFVVR
jgi:glucose/arabinose dehydrogenase/plastocyanin